MRLAISPHKNKTDATETSSHELEALCSTRNTKRKLLIIIKLFCLVGSTGSFNRQSLFLNESVILNAALIPALLRILRKVVSEVPSLYGSTTDDFNSLSLVLSSFCACLS